MTTRANTSNRPQTAWQQLKQRTLSVETIRQVDRTAVERFGMNSLVLMENAAIQCALWLQVNFALSRTLILCGRGNNGGDGLAIARHLRLAGWPCQVNQLGPIEKLTPDAQANWRILTQGTGHRPMIGLGFQPVSDLGENLLWDPTTSGSSLVDSERSASGLEPELIIDALLGSGAQGAPRAPMNDWIERANACSAKRIAIDIPSGLDATTGQPAQPTFRADATLTFVARKVGFQSAAAQEYLGTIEVLPIGIPTQLIEELLGHEQD